MKRKKYYYLDPVIIRIPGIKTLFEKSVGKRDARQNQVCSNGEVHTTPFIDAKVNSYNAHIEKLLLKTTNELAPMIQEANSLLVEYSLMESHKGGELPEGCGEEAQRQKAAVAANYALEERRKEEILKRLAKIRISLMKCWFTIRKELKDCLIVESVGIGAAFYAKTLIKIN